MKHYQIGKPDLRHRAAMFREFGWGWNRTKLGRAPLVRCWQRCRYQADGTRYRPMLAYEAERAEGQS